MQRCCASAKASSVSWNIFTALDAGAYTRNGFKLHCHRQYVRATGLPALSTWASAARSDGCMTPVECARNSGPYSAHVVAGVLADAGTTRPSNSLGFLASW